MLRLIQLRPSLAHATQASLAVVLAIGSMGTASAGKPFSLQRLGRHFGVGWGDGYHACRDGGLRPGADLAPQPYYDQFVTKKKHRFTGCENIYPPSTALCLPGEECDSDPTLCDGACDGTQDVSVFGNEIEFLGSPTAAGEHSPIEQPTIEQPATEESSLNSVEPPSFAQPSPDQTDIADPASSTAAEQLTPPSPEEIPAPQYAAPVMTIEPANADTPAGHDADLETVPSPSDNDAGDTLLDQSRRLKTRRLGVASALASPRQPAAMVDATTPRVRIRAPKSQSLPMVLSGPGFDAPRVLNNPFVSGIQPSAQVSQRSADNVIHQPR